MLDYMLWVFAGVMTLATIYFARRGAVGHGATDEINVAAAEKSIAHSKGTC